jgi:glycosyltransferase involved in cell wall biosynthesis
MKIVYLHQYFVTPAMSGGTRSYEFARRLVAAGHEVHVITSTRQMTARGPAWTTTLEDGIHVHWTPVPYGNAFGFVKRMRAFIVFAWRAAMRAVQVGGDVVFATSTPLTIALPAIIARRLLRAPMVFEVRDLWPEVPIAMGEIRSRPLILVARALERIAYRNSARVIALSPGMATGVARQGYPKHRIEVVPNACDISLFQSSDSALDPDFLPPGAGPLVLYAGTFGRVNGVGYLVDVAAAMKQSDPSIRFLLVGEGREDAQVRASAAANGTLDTNLWIRPSIPKSRMPALMRSATIACSVVIDVQALWNNSANKVFDALAAGRPVFINHGGWQKDLLEEHGAGFAVPPADPSVAAGMIKDFLSNADRVNAAGAAALRLATTQFSRDALSERFRRTLEAAVAESVSVRAA